MKKPTVLIIGPTPPPYMGPSVATKIIVESSELREKFNIIHLDTADRRSLTNIGKIDLGNIYLLILHLVRLLSLLIKFSPRLVYLPICQTVKGYLRDVAFMSVSRILGARIVIHLRGGYFRGLYRKANIWGKSLISVSMRIVARAIVLGQCLRSIFEGLVSDNHICVVPNGVEDMYSTHRFNKRGSAGDDKCVRVLFLSNLQESKGFIDILYAIPQIMKQYENVKFIFAGALREPEEIMHEVTRHMQEQGCLQHVIMLGSVAGEQKIELLESSDIFILPTYYKYEGQPWVIIEAMAAGLPIVTTDQGCIKEMVIDGENGFIIDKRKSEQIAEKIVVLLKDARLRGEMGEKSRERYLKSYTRTHFISCLAQVFQSVL
jgi:glycosyltransferase involved in cell wall biosynthesis